MSDLIITMDYDVSKVDVKQKKLNREFDISKQKAANITKEINNLSDELEKSKQKQIDLDRQLEQSGDKLEAAKKGEIQLTEKEFNIELKRNAEIQKQIDKEEAHQRSIEKSLASQNLALKKQNAHTADIGNQIVLNGKKQNKFTQSFEKSQKSADRFAKRLKSLIASALFFSVVTKAFTALRNEFGKLITETGTKTASLVAQLNGNLAVIGRTLYEGAKPYIERLLKKLVEITNVIAVGIAKALGKDITKMKGLVEQTKKLNKEAKGALASFDQINTLSFGNENNKNGSATANINVDNENLDDANKKLNTILAIAGAIGLTIAAWKLTNFISSLGLASGKASVFSGLLMTILGTIMLIQSYSDSWVNGISWENFGMLLGSLSLIVSGLGLAFGTIGVAIGTIVGGISLVVLGIHDMKQNGINAKNLLTVAIGAIGIEFGLLLIKTKSVGTALKALFSPTGALLIGVATLVAGIAYLAQNWDRLSPAQKTITVLGSLAAALTAAAVAVALFHTSWTIGAAAATIAAGVALLAGTYLFKTANQKGIKTDLSGSGAAPKSINKYAKYANMSNPIPKLATGAILPGGSPMLAWVNDQPKGQTYVEGSVENIVAAFEKYLSGKNFGGTAQDNRPIVLQIDGREIARATRSGNESLGNQTVFGGFANVY